MRRMRAMSDCEVTKTIGKGFVVAFAPAASTVTTVAVGQSIILNKIIQFNADTRCCKCSREPFARIPLNDTRIELGLRGVWQFTATIDIPVTATAQISFTDNEGNVQGTSIGANNATATARIPVYEDFMIIKLTNTGAVPIVLTQGTDPTNNLVVITGTYQGV